MVSRSPTDPNRLALQRDCAAALKEVQSVYVGPESVAQDLLVALLAGGHVLLEGVPGIAKTTLVKAFAVVLGCGFRRIQFTPDLLPADITGTYVLSPREGTFTLREGPLFAHMVLGDEINRAPAKTQSALLEAMQERQVTIEGETRPLPDPFMVLATQNPFEQAGTYPLPEAQLDRFLVRLSLHYPSPQNEMEMLRKYLMPRPAPRAVLSPARVQRAQQAVQGVHVEDRVLDYVVRLAAYTRGHGRTRLGASPRASLALVNAGRARAFLAGRDYVLPDDVRALAGPVFSHRLLLRAEAAFDGASTDQVIEEALTHVVVGA